MQDQGTLFQNLVQSFASQHGLQLAHSDEHCAVIPLVMPRGNIQVLFIRRYGSTLEFAAPSLPAFERIEDVPHMLSSLLLHRSAQRTVGFWSLVPLGERYAYCCMHNVDIGLINAEYFAKLVVGLIEECDWLETSLLGMMSQASVSLLN